MLDNDELKTRLEAQTAPKVTPDRIMAVIKDRLFVRPTGTLTICVLTLANGFTVTGESACASPENYNQDIGEKIAFDNAKEKIWALEGYALRDRLAAIDGLEPVAPNTYRKAALVHAVEAAEPETMDTKWGPQTARIGDFIITNPDGERYPCPRDTFLETYVAA